LDTVLIANQASMMMNISDRMHYDFLIRSVRKKKRFAPWHKPEKNEAIDLIMQIYGYSYPKAVEVMDLITDEDLENMRSILDVGGIRKSKKTTTT
jgi:hypothetical protein